MVAGHRPTKRCIVLSELAAIITEPSEEAFGSCASNSRRGTIAQDDEIVVIGSQAILGQYPDTPGILSVSAESDVLPLNRPDRANLIDGDFGFRARPRPQ
jgi:hypothetical protein